MGSTGAHLNRAGEPGERSALLTEEERTQFRDMCVFLGARSNERGSLFGETRVFTEEELAQFREMFKFFGLKFKMRFKVGAPDRFRHGASSKTSLDAEGGEMIHLAIQTVYGDADKFPTYCEFMRQIHVESDKYVREARSGDGAGAREGDGTRDADDCLFYVWFTMEIDQTMKCETRILPNPSCSRDTVRALERGEADVLWGYMQRVMCFVPFSACAWMLQKASASPGSFGGTEESNPESERSGGSPEPE